MDVTPLIRSEQKIIQSYAAGRFRVSGQIYETPILVTVTEVVAWPVSGIDQIFMDSAVEFLLQHALSCDVLLMGLGAQNAQIDFDVRRKLKDKKLNCEFMDTPAACRTFNVLTAEGRQVAAALYPL
jgi:uncharacterized protein